METVQLTKYQYGAMSSLFELEAPSKLTAYVAMVIHYDRSAHLVAIYEPVECKTDSWLSLDGKISDRLDEVFGGEGSFDKYVETHADEIAASYKSIKRLS